jgi:predicted phage-related endonuclease
MDVTKAGKPSAARTKLMHEILAERLTGDVVPHFVNDLMRWGLEQEPAAKEAFEVATGSLLIPCGFVDHPEIGDFGATPDSLLDRDAVVEFKCPQTTTHIAWKLAGVVPEQHRPQILAQLACTGRTRAVFVSFDPRVPPKSQLFIREWTPTKDEIAAVEKAARDFLAEVDAMWEVLTA